MGARARRTRPTAIRRRSPRAASAGSYHRSRAAVGLAIFILLFGLLWLLNGSFTADYITRKFHADILLAWSIHFVMSAIEVAPIFVAPFLKDVPRPIRVMLWLLSLPFGVLDVLSSALGIQPWFLWTGATGLIANLQNVALGEFVAFMPEPMLIWLLIGLRNTLRG
jgi:hypothetical protein